MGEREATVNFRFVGILRREEIVEFFPRVDHPSIRVAEARARSKRFCWIESSRCGCLPNELGLQQESLGRRLPGSRPRPQRGRPGG